MRNMKQTIPSLQKQLLDTIQQIKASNIKENILPQLEDVLSQIQTLSTHDILTGAYNRITLFEKIDMELARTQRTGHTFVVAVIGLDALSDLMEKCGQESVKQILLLFTESMYKVFRSLDSVGRVGAAEFAVVMPTTWLDQGAIAINRLRSQIELYQWAQFQLESPITFSVGLTANAPNDDVQRIFERAEQACLKVRQSGGNHTLQVEESLPNF